LAFVAGACGGGSKTPEQAPLSDGTKADIILGIPAGWSDTNVKSAEAYRAGQFLEAVAILDAFAKQHPKFADVELMIGDNWLMMPRNAPTPEAERLQRAESHLKRGLALVTDDLGRQWANSSLEYLAEKKRDLAARSKN
jgi:hypothetical protein